MALIELSLEELVKAGWGGGGGGGGSEIYSKLIKNKSF